MKTIILNESQLDKLFINEKLNNMDSPLYHFTTLERLGDILKTNMLGDYTPLPKRLRTCQGINNSSIDSYHKLANYKVDNKNFSGFETAVTSFTRDKNIDNGYPDNMGCTVRIKLSPQELLKDRNISLNPYNFFTTNKNGSAKQNCTILPHGRHEVESEERIIGGVMNLDKKVIGIDILLSNYQGGCSPMELNKVVEILYYLDNINIFKDRIHIYNDKKAFNFELVNKSFNLDEVFEGLLAMKKWGYWEPFENDKKT